MAWKEPSGDRLAGGDDCSAGYADNTATPPEPNPIPEALNLLAPWSNAYRPGSRRYPGRNAILIAVLGARASLEAIQGWRYGRRKAPQWARELLAAELLRENDRRAAVAEMLLSEKEKAPD